jgi:diguanylate cyclase (GGDEF)-like protein
LGLKAKIGGFVLLCVAVPLLVMGLYLLTLNQELLEKKVSESLSNQLDRKTTQVEDWLLQRRHETVRWSASFVVYEGLDALSRPGADPAKTRRELKDYLESVLGHFNVYESLFLVDLSGNVVASTRDERMEEWGQALLAKGGPPSQGAMSPLYRSQFLDRPTLIFIGPAGPERVERIRTYGYFVSRINLAELAAVLAASPTPDADPALSFWLLDEKGRVLLRPGRVVPQPGTDVVPAFVPGGTPERSVVDRQLPELGLTKVGLKALSSSSPLRGYLAATLPAAVANQPLADSRRQLLTVGVPAILAILALNILLAGRLLGPILRLSDGARRVSSGDLDVYLPASGGDEIGELTGAFNEMTRRLREGRLSLEEARDEQARTNEGLKAANRTLEALAITDGLTGLYNHRHFQETLEKEIRRCEREERMLSLLLLDLDHFKQYNDRFGHTEGDAALRRVAGQIMKSIRGTDVAFRYGGEEMAVLLPSCAKQRAAEVAEKVRVAVAEGARRPGRFGARTTVSVGVATFPEDGRVARALVDMADAALYAAKAAGRDRVVLAGSAAERSQSRGETAG